MKRAAVLVLALLAVCLYAAADPGPATSSQQQEQDFVRFGRQDLGHGLSTSALYYFNEALNLNANSFDAWLGKARALEQMQRLEDARKAADRALVLSPNNAQVLALQGKILFDEKKYENAIAQFNQALTLNSSDTVVYRWKGMALDSLGRHDEAQNAYTKATPPSRPYHGGITRLTTTGRSAVTDEEPYRPKRPDTGDDTLGTPGEPDQTAPRPEGYYDNGEEPAPPAARAPDNGSIIYYDDGSGYGYVYGHRGKHQRSNNEAGPARPGRPHSEAPYRGVVPLYQQSATPHYWQGVVPPADFHAAPDYHAAADNPLRPLRCGPRHR